MTIGGTLNVHNANGSFKVSFDRNVRITNYKHSGGLNTKNAGEIEGIVQNGNSHTNRVIKEQDKPYAQYNLGTFELNSQRYTVFNTLRALDGNANDISEKDLALAKQKLVGKNGVIAVKRDASAGITTIEFNDGAVLKFDFETDEEMAAKKKQESIKAQKKQEAAKKQQASNNPSKEIGFLDLVVALFKDRWLRH